MNQIRLIEDGNDNDFGEVEYEWGGSGETAAAAEQQAKFRAEAHARYVRLADDLLEVFPTTEAVNDALRRLINIERRAA